MKKIFSFILVVSLCFAVFAGPSSEKTGDGTTAMSGGVYILNYPANMQEEGFTEPVVLEKKPTRVVCLSVTPVLALHNIGVDLVAIPSTVTIDWPADLRASAEVINTSTSANFDIETVVSLTPDLVFLGKTTAETYGQILTDANIPVYYVDSGHTVSYDSVKTLTYELIETFGENSEAAEKIKTDFEELEARLEITKVANEGRTVMVLQSAVPMHYIQTKGGSLGSMLDMMGFTNVYENDGFALVLLDFEQAISYDPDIFFALARGGNTSEEVQVIMETDYANNQSYWDSIDAVKNGNTIYMPISFVSSGGINMINKINELIDMLEEYDAR